MMRRIGAGGVALVLLGALLATAAWAAGENDVFTVAAVPVDATAANANAARDVARHDGERHAYEILLDRLTLTADRARLPHATDAILNELVQGFEVANERSSAVRYLANYTFHFRADQVRRLLRQAKVPFAETPSKPLVVLAVLQDGGSNPVLWEDPNPWRKAWAVHPPSRGLVPLVIPLGELEDVAAIDAAAATSGDEAHLQAISAHYNGDGVLVSRAALKADQDPHTLDVTTTRYNPGAPGSEQTWVASYAANPGESDDDLMARAVTGTIAQVEEAWKTANIVDFNQTGTLVATVPVTDLPSWIAVRQRLSSIATIERTDLLALDRHNARIAIHYIGGQAQLQLALAQRNLTLSGTDPNWVLERRTSAPKP